MGNDVYLTVTVPSADIDDAKPASLQQIEIYAVTAPTPPPAGLAFLAVAKPKPVVTIPVAREADPSDRSGTVVPDPKTGALQGTSVTVKDSLLPDDMVATERPAPAGQSAARGARTPAATAGADAVAPQVLRRFYIAVPFSDRRRPGPTSAVAEVPMTLIPGKVPTLGSGSKRTGHDVVLLWEPAGGLLGWLLERAFPAEPAPVEERRAAGSAASKAPAPPSGPVLYNIYRDTALDPVAVPGPKPIETPWTFAPAVPINKEPQTALTFMEDVPFDGRERCYYVRAVRGTGAQRVEGEASERWCDVPIDDEAPAAPTGLTAAAEEGIVSLRWEPNGEEDLVGYLVLRRDPGSDTLRPLTPAPIAETQFTDRSAMAGQMYTYIVQAVDKQTPKSNVSAGSMEVMVTAR